MHNGVVANFMSIKRDFSQLLTLEEYSNIRGSTDSEYMAAMYIHHLTKGRGEASWEEDFALEQMAAALTNTIINVLACQAKTPNGESDAEPIKPSSLNLAVTDGIKLVAVRFRNHAVEQPPSLYWSNTAGVSLNSKYAGLPEDGENTLNATKTADKHGVHVIVASEPTTFHAQEWHLIKQNEMILVDSKGRISFEPCLADWEVR